MVGVEVAPPAVMDGPDQEKVAPGVVDDPARLTEVVVQVNTISIPAFELGIPTLPVTEVVPDAVHPFAGLVAVIVYVPATLTVGVQVVPPETIPGPAQVQVAPAVDEDPARLTEVMLQVKFCGGPAFTLGGVLLSVTETLLVEVQPLDGLVTVMV